MRLKELITVPTVVCEYLALPQTNMMNVMTCQGSVEDYALRINGTDFSTLPLAEGSRDDEEEQRQRKLQLQKQPWLVTGKNNQSGREPTVYHLR